MLYRRGRVWWVKFYQDGQSVRMSSGSDDEAVARRLLKEQTARVTLKEPLVVRSARVTYDELRDDLVAHYQATGERDLDEAGWRLRHLDRAFHGLRAGHLTGDAIARYIVKRQQEGAANGTANREVGVLLRMLRLGLERNKVVRMPIVHRPKEAPPRAGFFEADAFQAVRAELPEDFQVAVTIAYTFGWRKEEILTLERRQLDLAAGTLRLDPGSTKNDEGRVVYLTPELSALLAAHVARVEALERRLGQIIAPLFPHFTGPHRGTRRRDIRRAWAKACRCTGYAGKLVHDFRRTAARNLVNAGVPEKVAMTITGHKTRGIFDRYHIVSPGDLKTAAAKLAQHLSGTIEASSGTVTPLRPIQRANESRV
jgi:integrase